MALFLGMCIAFLIGLAIPFYLQRRFVRQASDPIVDDMVYKIALPPDPKETRTKYLLQCVLNILTWGRCGRVSYVTTYKGVMTWHGFKSVSGRTSIWGSRTIERLNSEAKAESLGHCTPSIYAGLLNRAGARLTLFRNCGNWSIKI